MTDGTKAPRARKGRAKFENTTLTFTLFEGEKVADTLVHTFGSKLEAFGAASAVQTAYSNAEDYIGVARETWAKVLDGTWIPGRTPGEEPTPLVVLAVAQAMNRPVAEIEDQYDAMDPVTKRALRKHPDVAPILANLELEAAKLRAKKAKKNTDAKVDLAAAFGAAQPAAA